MPHNKWATAKEIGVAPATLTAMARRNIVTTTDTSPKQYKRIITNATVLEMLLFYYPAETFGLYKADETLGMLCTIKSGNVYDCWGNSFDLLSAAKVRIKDRYFSLINGKEIA